MPKLFTIIFSICLILSFSSCVPASEEDDFDEIKVGHIPLKTGNKWIYEINRGSENFIDSAEILDYFPYQIDELTNKYLYQYKDIPFTLEMAQADTVWIKLIEYYNNKLLQYGSEKRDSSASHFPYGDPVIFPEPLIILDHGSIDVEELFIDSLRLTSGTSSIVLRDTLVNCIKTRNILYSDSYITTDLNYDLFYYFTEFGILKIEGSVNNSSFSAKAVRCNLK